MLKTSIKNLYTRVNPILFVIAGIVIFGGSIFAQTTNEQKLSYLTLGNVYTVSNGYYPNGGHAGIDFSGTGTGVTAVKSPVSGTIIANTSTCGKVAIYDGKNTTILAHMSNLTSQTSGQISRGDYVGTAAQVVGGGCVATGPHLHIEIRTGYNATMANPSSNNTSTTLNPLTYFDYNQWEFNTNNDFQNWTIYNISAASVSGGNIFMDPWNTPNDPYLFSPYISLKASDYRYVKMRMASNALDGNGAIYFKTAAENYYSEDKKVQFTVYNCYLCGNASFYTYSVYIGSNYKWSGTITGIRVDPAEMGQGGTNLDTIGIDYIRLSTTP